MKLSIPAAAVLVASAALASAPRAHADGRDWTGSAAPDISAQDAVNGLQPGTTLASLRGKVVVVKFFFVGCPACRGSLPKFQRLHEAYAPRGAVVVGVDARDSRGSIQSLLDSSGYTFPVIVDPYAADRYGVQSYPTNYVIGSDGVVKAYVRWDEDFPTWIIDRELAGNSRQRNVDEMGSIPRELEAVKAAALLNDYGEVLRIVEPHLGATEPEAVKAAARRIQAIAYLRYQRRSERINSLWNASDFRGAYAAVKALASDFRGTSRQSSAESWVAAYRESQTIKDLHLD